MTNNNVFKDMREQMQPDEQNMARLQRALEADASSMDVATHTDDTFQMSGEPQVYATLPQNAGTAQAPPSTASGMPGSELTGGGQHRRRSKVPIAVYLSAAAVVLVVFIAAAFLINGKLLSNRPSIGGIGTNLVVGADVDYAAGSVRVPADYQEVYEVIAEANAGTRGIDQMLRGSVGIAENSTSEAAPMAAEDSGVGGYSPPATTAEPSAPTSAPVPEADYAADYGISPTSTVGDYSETNVQVKGIDEGDIIKTDGNYIYAVSTGSGNDLVIVEAAGQSTRELSRVALVEVDSEDPYRYNGSPQELYISGSTLIVVMYAMDYSTTDDAVYYGGNPVTKLLCFDVSDPSAPVMVKEFSQSGYFNSSRLNAGMLYIISTYYLYEAADSDNPASFIPMVAENGNSELLRPSDICIMPVLTGTGYTVVTSLDVATLTRVDQKSVLGDASVIYMSQANLYIGSGVNDLEAKGPYQESVYTVEEYTYTQATELIRIGIESGQLDVAAQCTVKGSLLNQFSLDEYQGNLRLVVTVSDYSYRILIDESHGIRDVQYLEQHPMTNAVYVLDPSMNTIGGIEGLAEDERIYSARFTGDIGYMVTYRQVDPLFAIDLSDPQQPKITSELKIPGFSTYLHPFTEGRLLGFGYNAEAQVTNGMKLSMFDISDPFAVTEYASVAVDASSSEALYDHKAVLVDVNKNLIGFPGYGYDGKNYYYVYEYFDEGGFVLRDKLSLGGDDYFWGSIRALYAGDYLYVYSGFYLDVFRLEDLQKVATLQIQESSDYEYGVMPLMVE